MPMYEYYCAANDQTVEVLHGMNDTLISWGELCDRAEIHVGKTPRNAIVEKKLSVSLLPSKGDTHHHGIPGGTNGFGGCCGGVGSGPGGGCGCSGH